MPINVRAEIINQFRNRIKNGDRLRLSKEDLSRLIDAFVELLQEAKTEGEIRIRCETEIKLLEEGYPQPSVAKYLTRYRKAIIAAIEDGTLKLTEDNSHRFIHQQRVTGVREERLEHWALTYFKYTPEVYESIDRRSQRVNRDKQLNLRLVPVDSYLEMLRGFLSKKGQFEARWLAVAIAGLTGRRFAEVIAKGSFSLTAHPHLLRFEGQLKSRAGRGEEYDIVTLFPADEVLEAISRLRRLPEIRAITRLTSTALSAALNVFNQKLNTVCGKVLMQVVPPMEGKKAVSVHNLRSLYGAIAVYFFCPELQHEYAFVQHFLGHVMDSPATGHYFRFALQDAQGNLLRDKGVLLDRVEPLPLGGTVKVPMNETNNNSRAMESANEVSRLKEKKMHQQEAMPEGEAITTAAELEQTTASRDDIQQLRNDWRLELNRQMEQLRADFEVQLQEIKQDSNAGWFVRRVEGLEKENLRLRAERDRAIASAGQGLNAELERLRADNEKLTHELKSARDKLDGFRRLLIGGDAVDSTETTLEEFKPEVLPIFSKNSVRMTQEKGQAINPVDLPLDIPTQNNTPGMSQRAALLKSRHPMRGKAFHRAEAIFLAIKDWNRLKPSESFAINPGVLETIFKVHRQAAKDFFEAYQNELWDYHQEIGVESPRWHNRGKDTAKLKAFVDERLKEE